jgi:hypothetical protein
MSGKAEAVVLLDVCHVFLGRAVPTIGFINSEFEIVHTVYV